MNYKLLEEKVASGVPWKVACEALGMPRRKAERLYREGEDAVEAGLGECEAILLYEAVVKGRAKITEEISKAVAQKALEGDFRSAEWIMKRSDPEIYNDKEASKAEGANEIPQFFIGEADYSDKEPILIEDTNGKS